MDYIDHFSPVVNIVQLFISILFCALGVSILFIFRNLLNVQHQFHAADHLIVILVWIHLLYTVSGLFKTIMPETEAAEWASKIIGMALLYIMGIVNIVFGIRLLKIKNTGLLKYFAYATIVSGVCIVSILLAPFGLLAAVAAYILQSLIFLQAAEEAEFV